VAKAKLGGSHNGGCDIWANREWRTGYIHIIILRKQANAAKQNYINITLHHVTLYYINLHT